MSEQNEIPEPETSPTQPKELCTMRIAFPIESDEQALAVKKQISDILTGIPKVQIHFSIMSIPEADIPHASRIR